MLNAMTYPKGGPYHANSQACLYVLGFHRRVRPIAARAAASRPFVTLGSYRLKVILEGSGQ